MKCRAAGHWVLHAWIWASESFHGRTMSLKSRCQLTTGIGSKAQRRTKAKSRFHETGKRFTERETVFNQIEALSTKVLPPTRSHAREFVEQSIGVQVPGRVTASCRLLRYRQLNDIVGRASSTTISDRETAMGKRNSKTVAADTPANEPKATVALSSQAGESFEVNEQKLTPALFSVAYEFFEDLKMDASSDPELTTADLVRQLKGTSSEAVHHLKINKAIDELITLGHLMRRSAHGLTIPVSSYYRQQYLDNRELKDTIAKELVKHIEPGTSLACTDGTTVANCVEVMLQKRRHVAIVTNNIGIAELAIEDIDIQLTGGSYLSSTHSCTGETACKFFEKYPCRSVLLGVSGIGENGELYVYHAPDCKIRDAAIGAATDSIIVVADASKLGKRDRWHFATLSSLLESHDVTLITNHPTQIAAKDRDQAGEILDKLRNIKGTVKREDQHYRERRSLTLIEAGYSQPARKAHLPRKRR